MSQCAGNLNEFYGKVWLCNKKISNLEQHVTVFIRRRPYKSYVVMVYMLRLKLELLNPVLFIWERL
jgi:hypothetical protein